MPISREDLPTTTKLALRFAPLCSNSFTTSRPLLLGAGMSLTLRLDTLFDKSSALRSFDVAPGFCDFLAAGFWVAGVIFLPADERLEISPLLCPCKIRTFRLGREHNVVGTWLRKCTSEIRRRGCVGQSKDICSLRLFCIWSRSDQCLRKSRWCSTLVGRGCVVLCGRRLMMRVRKCRQICSFA